MSLRNGVGYRGLEGSHPETPNGSNGWLEDGSVLDFRFGKTGVRGPKEPVQDPWRGSSHVAHGIRYTL